jgi:hypothetical protein
LSASRFRALEAHHEDTEQLILQTLLRCARLEEREANEQGGDTGEEKLGPDVLRCAPVLLHDADVYLAELFPEWRGVRRILHHVVILVALGQCITLIANAGKLDVYLSLFRRVVPSLILVSRQLLEKKWN